MALRDLNLNLILGQASQHDLEKLELQFKRAPHLPSLCPLAKAAFLKATQRKIPLNIAEKALETVFIIAGEDCEALLEGENIIVFENEKVEHSIRTIDTAGSEIIIEFKSEGEISDFVGNSDGWLSLGLLNQNPVDNLEFREKAILEALQAKVSRTAPQCYPCDSDFIGVVTYKVDRINGAPAGGFQLVDYGHSFEGCGEKLAFNADGMPTLQWIGSLGEEQSVVFGDERILNLDDAVTVITRDQLLESYQSGKMAAVEIDRFVVCMGSGASWHPNGIVEDEWSNEIDLLKESDAFPEHQIPLVAWALPNPESGNDQNLKAASKLISDLFHSIKQE